MIKQNQFILKIVIFIHFIVFICCEHFLSEQMHELTDLQSLNPFLRWTGSKRWFVKNHLEKFLPKCFNNYHEPFLGGGAVFFNLARNREINNFFLSDSNLELIQTYIELRDNPVDVIGHLKKMKNTQEFYYKMRDLKPSSLSKKAARFIYLNKTSFNGIYRVNSKGVYNVPYGKRENVDFVSEKHLLQVSKVLTNVSIENQTFIQSLNNIKEGDLIFLDPPYTVSHESNGFIEYNQKLFSWEDQILLREFISIIKDKGAYFILTNAKHKSIMELYEGIGGVKSLSRYSQVGGRVSTRGVFNELVIYNTK